MKYIFLSLGLLLSGMAQAQTAPTPPCPSLSGFVVGASKQPLAGVSVTLKGTKAGAITNSEGYYTLSSTATEQPALQFTAAGYEPQTVTVTSCADSHIEMKLLPGTRIKQRGKRKGFIMKTPPVVPKQ